SAVGAVGVAAGAGAGVAAGTSTGTATAIGASAGACAGAWLVSSSSVSSIVRTQRSFRPVMTGLRAPVLERVKAVITEVSVQVIEGYSIVTLHLRPALVAVRAQRAVLSSCG